MNMHCSRTGLWAVIVAVICGTAISSPAEEIKIVVPSGLEDTEGNAQGDPTFSGVGFRAQVAYSAEEFGDLPNTHHFITAIAMRPDASVRESRTVDWGNTQWVFATTDRSVDDMSRVFSENLGEAQTLVYDGPLSFHTDGGGPPSGPRGFDYRFELGTPFFYDPTQGKNLVIDFTVPSGYRPASREDEHDISGNQLFVAIPATLPEANYVFPEELIFQLTFESVVQPGDFDGDGRLTSIDIDDLTAASGSSSTDLKYDLNNDSQVNGDDVNYWAQQLKKTWIGDADVNMEFNSADFVQAFIAGKYESEQAAVWSEGDWDGNGKFYSSDFVTAFVDGGYEMGPRTAASCVPEPGAGLLLAIGIAGLLIVRLQRSHAYTRIRTRFDLSVKPTCQVAVLSPLRSRSVVQDTFMNVRRTISQPSATLARLTWRWLMSPTVTLSLFLVASLVAEANANRFSRVIAFGESSTDSGNVFELSEAKFPPSPPYFNGGWSNGPVWLDMVSEQLGFGLSVPSLRGGTNYAYGGARSGLGETVTNCSDMGLTMCFDVSVANYGTQISMFLADTPVVGDDDLLMLWGGHNDMFAQLDPAVVADNLAADVATLLDRGAKNIVFLKLFSGVGQSDQVNSLVSPRLVPLASQHPDASLIVVDIPKMTDEFFQDPAKYGITKCEGQALNTRTLEVVPNPDEYLSWDGIHVTTAFNRVIADYVLKSLEPDLFLPGDFDGDGGLTASDIDVLSVAVQQSSVNLAFDLNHDRMVDPSDHRFWVRDLKHTWFGDADLNGEFTSADFVQVFAVGKYETGESAGLADGDWNGDGIFTSGDFIVAFADGGYEQGPRTDTAAVPEPGAWTLSVIGLSIWLFGAAAPGRRQRAA